MMTLVLIDYPYHIHNNNTGKEKKYRSKLGRIRNRKDEKSIYKCEW